MRNTIHYQASTSNRLGLSISTCSTVAAKEREARSSGGFTLKEGGAATERLGLGSG